MQKKRTRRKKIKNIQTVFFIEFIDSRWLAAPPPFVSLFQHQIKLNKRDWILAQHRTDVERFEVEILFLVPFLFFFLLFFGLTSKPFPFRFKIIFFSHESKKKIVMKQMIATRIFLVADWHFRIFKYFNYYFLTTEKLLSPMSRNSWDRRQETRQQGVLHFIHSY